ncbi:hypothetical protein ADL22_16085 [Streptomyces sp. NRRL F-4489]|uniref:hypothetical protein n=1 Tax=Streptomyces sp. NRRL F-4489 TaxID=1609095 RepID=UPI000749C50C|nr:hypothetical protein [Streptomyces sp. NRRL F-4489]KUL38797.1 hypothetical protein ADL22_16085 [Streptomyces sp. NRRL F-4489]
MPQFRKFSANSPTASPSSASSAASPQGADRGRVVSRRWVLAGLAAAAPVALAACGGHKQAAATLGPHSPAGSGSGDAVIMIIRHGEKPDKTHPGIDEHGHKDHKSLTRRGWDRANALPSLFDPPKGHPLPSGLSRPRTIFAATDQGPHAGAHRMRQTVTPLAQHMGLTLNTTYAETQEAALAKAALSATGPVLICWEHSRIPDIVTALGASGTGVPHKWPNRFDLVWILTRTHGTWSFRQVNQHLLPGDA